MAVISMESFNFTVLKLIAPIVSLFLAAIMMYNSLHISFMYAYYYLDRVDFIEKLCVNKDKPEMKCNGKCHLKKVVKEETGDDGKVPFKRSDFKEIILFVVGQTTYSFLRFALEKQEQNTYRNLYAYSVISILDHPPQI